MEGYGINWSWQQLWCSDRESVEVRGTSENRLCLLPIRNSLWITYFSLKNKCSLEELYIVHILFKIRSIVVEIIAPKISQVKNKIEAIKNNVIFRKENYLEI